jgi:hypothetical protein
MGFGKPFRAEPIKLGPYHAAQARRRSRVFVAKIFGGAVVIGLGAGVASTETGWALAGGIIPKGGGPASVYYPRCDYARAAGVAPIRAGEPGYRPELDADRDGIACEPYSGS